MKLRYWERRDLPAPAKWAAVGHDQWMKALVGSRSQIVWRLAGHTTVTHDWARGPRQLDEHLVYMICSGGPVRLQIDQQATTLSPGALMWLAPRVPHRLSMADTNEPVTLYHLRFRVCRGQTDLYVKPTRIILAEAPEVRWEMEQIVQELPSQQLGVETRCRAMLASLSVAVFRQLSRARASTTTFTGTQRGQLITYVRGHLKDRLRPADLAQQIDLSPGYFTRIFRESFGQSPRKWLLEQRIHEVARLLVESNLNISQIADHLGYRDVFLLSRQFKQVTGLSPTAYRQSF